MQLDFLILREIYENKDTTQRSLSDAFFISLGKVNQVMKELKDKNYIDIEQVNNKNVKYKITKEGKNYLEKYKVDRCIILACGKGVRIQPLTYDTPKSLLKVKGEVLIERIINQLHERKIKDIVVMVGFYKEQFEYLIDKYNVKLVYNNEYDNKNTLATLYHASEFVEKKNCYITVSDIYQEENLFHIFECEPFYTGAFKHDLKNEWQFVTNKKNKLLYIVEGGVDAYYMVGASFFTKDFSTKFMKLINEYYKLESTDNFYWEDVLVRNLDSLPDFYVHKVREDVIHEFDNIKDYLEYNKTLNDTGSKVFSFVEKFFKIEADDMKNIECVKEGLTNRSYTFSLTDKKYIARVPGLGTSEFINRKNEVETYKKLKNKKFIENVLYIDKDGYKITEYIDDTIKTDMKDINHLKRIVDLYKKLHSSKIKVGFNNEPMNMINEYLDIMKKKNIPPLYQDFDESVEHVKKIDKFLNKNKREKVFTHGDANPGNVLLSAKNKKDDKLIDFEYAGMADPITDIALFSVYSHLNMEESLKYLKLYDEKASKKLTYIYFCYLALYGFYNAIWARVRENDGNVETGTFGMDNYHYFKTFFKYLNNNKII